MAKTRTPIGNEDSDYIRCSYCNFYCLLTRDKRFDGNGNSYTTLTGVVSQEQYPDDWTVKFGCPQCGKGDYDKK